jgi:hypothetical protein
MVESISSVACMNSALFQEVVDCLGETVKECSSALKENEVSQRKYIDEKLDQLRDEIRESVRTATEQLRNEMKREREKILLTVEECFIEEIDNLKISIQEQKEEEQKVQQRSQPSIQELADKCGMLLRTTREALFELENKK